MKRLIIFCWLSILGLASCQNEPTQIPQKMASAALVSEFRRPIELPDPQTLKFAKGIDGLMGVWIRKDLVETLKKTRSWFETWQILKTKPGFDFFAMSIDKHYEEDSLMIGYSTFDTQMPGSLYISCNQKPQVFGYKATSNYGVGREGVYLNLQNDELVVRVKEGEKLLKLIFQKRSYENPKFRNQVRGTFKGIMVGNYQLLNAQKKHIKDVWFDKLGRTNLLGFKEYWVRISFLNSLNFSVEVKGKSDAEKQEMRKQGAVDQEDLLHLLKTKEKIEHDPSSFQDLILSKIKNGFAVYTMKEKSVRMWRLVHKKELKYYLIKKE